MALRDEQADILGGPILQRPETSFFTILARYHFAFKSVTLLGLGLLVWIMCARGLAHLKKHRELRYRKAMRRKHGIPDSDCRPFAVAYAAAKRARLAREARDRKEATNYMSDHNLPAVGQRNDAQRERGLRRRIPETTVQSHDYQLPGKHAVACDNKRPEVHSLDSVDRYNPNPRHRVTVQAPLPLERPSVRRASRKDLVLNDNNEESRKRSFEDESVVEHEIKKKSRIDGDELIDGDEQADWYAQYADVLPQRASKEQPPPGNCIFIDDRARVNDFRDEEHKLIDEAMEGIDQDEELKALARGKKRDRAEAGSTLGGDDDDDIQNGRVSHHRKRRTIVQRTTEVFARGQKRDRDIESPESEHGGGSSETSRRLAQRSFKKIRAKKAASDEVSKMSVEDPCVSKDPLCSGRRVGDEWEAGGVQYKVGDKGERLRLTLVKKARDKHHMPQDSQHPDRSTALEIYVETWMTEEQYNQAEGRQELARQEALRETSGNKTPDVPDSPTKNGKNLLWDSVKGSHSHRSFREFMPAGASTRINPFERLQLQSTLGRRVTSSSTIVSLTLPGVVDSSIRPGFRGLSKWEKQDREAEALTRIRAKIEAQKKAQAASQKSAEIPKSVTAPELGTKSSSVPTITFTLAPVVAAEGGSDSNIPLGKSNTSTSFFVTSPSTSDSIKAAPAAGPGFSLPSTSNPSTTPLFPSAPTAPSTVPPSPFSFAKPQVPLSTSTTASSSAIPNPFTKEIGSGTQTASTPSPLTLGAITQPQPHSTNNPSQPTPSSFARPDDSSSTPSPVVFPPATKSQTPSFGATSNSSPSPVIFGSSPAVTKAEAPAHPPVSVSATATQTSKPSIPLFSFSGAFTSTATVPASLAPSAPKFSFGQSPAASTFTPSSNLASSTASPPKLAFKFGQTPPGVTESDPASKILAVDEPKKSAVPVSVFGTAANSNEPVKPPPFGIATAFGSSTSSFPSALATNVFGNQVTVDSGSGASASTPPRPTMAPASAMTFGNKISSTPVRTSSFAPAFGKSDAATAGTQSKPTASFTFGVPSGATGTTFGQPSTAATSGDSTQSIFGKPTSATPSTFGFPGTGSSSSSSPFAFGKPAAQNQKQEQ